MIAGSITRPMKQLDSFPAKVPGLNIQGQMVVPTSIGGCVTFFTLAVTFLFATLKFQHLILRHNPTINTHIEYYAASGTTRLEIDDPDFQIAVGLVNFWT